MLKLPMFEQPQKGFSARASVEKDQQQIRAVTIFWLIGLKIEKK
jgi:hypothetical protein